MNRRLRLRASRAPLRSVAFAGFAMLGSPSLRPGAKDRRGEGRFIRCIAVPRLPRAHQGAARQRQAQVARLQHLPRRHGGASRRLEEAADDEDRSRHLRRLPPEPVPVVRADGLAPHCALRKEADTGPAPDPAYDLLLIAARLHARAQSAALAHVRAARSIRRRPRVRRPLRHQGRLALPRRNRRFQRDGRRRRPVSRTTATKRRSSPARRPRRTRCACPARRRITSSNGRTWAIRSPARNGAAPRRWSSSRRRRSMRSTASSATTPTPRSRGSSATR